MADKLTAAVLDGLSRAAAEPAGLPLVGSKTDPGLFPPTAVAKPAAQKCLADGLVRVVRTETRGKAAVELYALSDAGWEFLLARVNPREVLEDFVRALESRQGQVDDLVADVRRMADNLGGLKDAVARVLPQVAAGRVTVEPNPPAPFPTREGGAREDGTSFPPPFSGTGPGDGFHPPASNGSHAMTAVATLADPRVELAAAIRSRLADWAASAAVGQDCPLPELYRSLDTRDPAPTVGEFHDCLRAMHAAGRVYLHPWTGPLYALPEPTYALLCGHNIAYYASAR